VPKDWEARDRKLRKRRNADMVVTNRSIRDTILPLIGRRAKEVTDKQKRRKERSK